MTMIVRQAVLRQGKIPAIHSHPVKLTILGRRLVAPTRRNISRPFASRVDRLASIEQSLDNHTKETRSILSHIQDSTKTAIPDTSASENPTSTFFSKTRAGKWVPREREFSFERQIVQTRPGDWICSPCGEHNFTYYSRCVNCKSEKEAEHTFEEEADVEIEVKRKKVEAPLAKKQLETLPKAIRPKKAKTSVDPIVAREASFEHVQSKAGQLGSVITPHYQPNQLIFNPPKPSNITLELLMASQTHLGHATSRWNPMNSRYIYGEREGVHIISLDATASHLRRACRVVSGVSEQGGLVLFVGTRPGQDLAVIEAAKNSGGCHLFEKWKPGSISNRFQILRECELKAVDKFDRDIDGFNEELMELLPLKPDLVVCLNPIENWVLLHECALFQIPTIGIIDTDADPTWVTYPIPANDDSIRAINLITGALGMAGKEGKEARLENARRGGSLKYGTTDMLQLREDTAIPMPGA